MTDLRQPVRWVLTERRQVLQPDTTAFALRQELGWVWLQRLAIAILRWVGAYREECVEVRTRTTQENDALLSRLLGQEGQFLELAYRHQQMHIYMGPDDHPELMMLVNGVGGHVTFDAKIKIGFDRAAPQFHTIPITVVPWMKGAIIVPV